MGKLFSEGNSQEVESWSHVFLLDVHFPPSVGGVKPLSHCCGGTKCCSYVRRPSAVFTNTWVFDPGRIHVLMPVVSNDFLLFYMEVFFLLFLFDCFLIWSTWFTFSSSLTLLLLVICVNILSLFSSFTSSSVASVMSVCIICPAESDVWLGIPGHPGLHGGRVEFDGQPVRLHLPLLRSAPAAQQGQSRQEGQ